MRYRYLRLRDFTFALRFCAATFAPCLPSAVRTLAGSFEIVFFFLAAAAAFFTFFRAAMRCFVLDMGELLSSGTNDAFGAVLVAQRKGAALPLRLQNDV